MLPPQAICLVIGYASLLIESTQMPFWQVTLLLLNPAEDNVAVGTQRQLIVYIVRLVGWPQMHRQLVSRVMAALQSLYRNLMWRWSYSSQLRSVT